MMRRFHSLAIGLMGVVAFEAVLIGVWARAQSSTPPPADSVPTITTGLAHENVGALADRAPGIMVGAGIARAQSAVNLPRSAATITQTDTRVSFRELFITGASEILLQEFEDLLAYFEDLLFARAGLPPIDRSDNGNDNTDSNTNDNTNANDNTNDNSNDNADDNSNANTNINDNTADNQNDNTLGITPDVSDNIGSTDVTGNSGDTTTGRPPQTSVRKKSTARR